VGERRVAKRLHLDLHGHVGRCGGEQLVEAERALIGGIAAGVAQAPGPDLGRGPLVGEAIEGRSERKQGVV
jgi:hypothetical protein